MSGFLFEEGGPIFAIQLENELTDNAAHIKTLKDLALELGLKAPIYTATGWNATYGAAIPERDVLPVFGGYADAPWEEHTRQLEPVSHYFSCLREMTTPSEKISLSPKRRMMMCFR